MDLQVGPSSHCPEAAREPKSPLRPLDRLCRAEELQVHGSSDLGHAHRGSLGTGTRRCDQNPYFGNLNDNAKFAIRRTNALDR
jgi:hypothetical protein